jgi:YVTN family beta-propeller protein
MRAAVLATLFGVLLTVSFADAPAQQASAPRDKPAPHRSPTDLALSPDGKWILTANSTSDTASLIDVAEKKVVAEIAVGKRPFSAAIAPDSRRAIVTNLRSNTVSVLSWSSGPDAKVEREFVVGHEPRGVVYSADGKSAYVVLALQNAVVAVDPAAGTVGKAIPVGERPHHIARSPDGRRLAVSNSKSADISYIDVGKLETVRTVRTSGDFLRHIAFTPDGQFAAVTHLYSRGSSTNKGDIGRGWVLANHISRAPLEKGQRQVTALDVNTKAVGDSDGLAFSADGKWTVVAAGGTHELIVLKNERVKWFEFGQPGDFIEASTLQQNGFRRVELGGRPTGVVMAADSRTCYVANYFENSVQIVDAVDAKTTGAIALGGPEAISPERRGEMLFHDARLSHHQWYSCASCHFEGHTIHSSFDTLNDKRYGNPKKTLSLRNAVETGPWTWHGWQADLADAMNKSIVESMQGNPVPKADAEAMVAYLGTLSYPVNPNRNPDGSLTEAAKRGREVFRGEKANCSRCHSGPYFTDGMNHNVGTGERGDAFPGYNTPSLLGTYDRAPYLHDARAKTLETLLNRHHSPAKLNGKGDLTEAELKDLIEYVKQL